jgi:Serum amyloid A protein
MQVQVQGTIETLADRHARAMRKSVPVSLQQTASLKTIEILYAAIGINAAYAQVCLPEDPSCGGTITVPPPTDNNGTCAARAFLRNYGDMRRANTIGSDWYFHCKANCEATRCGPSGADRACELSDSREWFDQHIKGDPPSASAADQAANQYGRSNAGNPGSCAQVCQIYRPRGLPAQY